MGIALVLITGPIVFTQAGTGMATLDFCAIVYGVGRRALDLLPETWESWSQPSELRRLGAFQDLGKTILSPRLSVRKSAVATSGQNAPLVAQAVVNSPGQPLDQAARTFMEPRFNHDFSKVRIHAGPLADESASAIGARAYAVLNHIVFAGAPPTVETEAGRRSLAHELTHVVQQSGRNEDRGSRFAAGEVLTSSVRIGAADDRYEQEANATADAMARARADSPRRFTPARPMIQRQVGMIGLYSTEGPRERAGSNAYSWFMFSAAGNGLPVKFLLDVARLTTISLREINEYQTFGGWLLVNMDEGVVLNPWRPSQSLEVQRVYHESTHAYLYQHKDEAPIKQFYERGSRYYENAPTQFGGTASDSEVAFQEACAVYVGNRAAAWWAAYTKLAKIATGDLSVTRQVSMRKKAGDPLETVTLHEIDEARSEYESTMAERVVGYAVEGSPRQNLLTRPISGDLRTFLDRELLEGKIPDKFDDVPGVFKAALEAAKRVAASQSPNRQ